MIKQYQHLSLEYVYLSSQNSILSGSIVSVPVEIDEVKVTEYQDGFADKSSFEEITFE